VRVWGWAWGTHFIKSWSQWTKSCELIVKWDSDVVTKSLTRFLFHEIDVHFLIFNWIKFLDLFTLRQEIDMEERYHFYPEDPWNSPPKHDPHWHLFIVTIKKRNKRTFYDILIYNFKYDVTVVLLRWTWSILWFYNDPVALMLLNTILPYRHIRYSLIPRVGNSLWLAGHLGNKIGQCGPV